jgi:hypothetical protein
VEQRSAKEAVAEDKIMPYRRFAGDGKVFMDKVYSFRESLRYEGENPEPIFSFPACVMREGSVGCRKQLKGVKG